ncbi:hypothetical protein IRJ41_002576 [Triplophysa rosa]|uniref:Uncharacterized protein n=1 Tax=Triplophysa rosa TaxID=992332 RepID=A0A9W7WQ23_TRIRA|nr:hypothetical protein IRJ41_002576 [Triplophysa rosa]
MTPEQAQITYYSSDQSIWPESSRVNEERRVRAHDFTANHDSDVCHLQGVTQAHQRGTTLASRRR